MASYCIVTGCDAKYFQNCLGLLSSIVGINAKKVVFDFGLNDEQKVKITDLGGSIAQFSYPFDYPARSQVEAMFPGFGGMLVRPYLPQLIENTDVLMWIDADAWVQDENSVLELIKTAWRFGIAVVPEIDRSYKKFTDVPYIWNDETLLVKKIFGEATATLMRLEPVINSGIIAARSGSNIWGLWQNKLKQALENITVIDDNTRMVEQISFNIVIKEAKLQVIKFPSLYNWMACLANPAWDVRRGLFVDPSPPYDPIKILHTGTQFHDKRLQVRLINAKSQIINDATFTYFGKNELNRFFGDSRFSNIILPWPPEF